MDIKRAGNRIRAVLLATALVVWVAGCKGPAPSMSLADAAKAGDAEQVKRNVQHGANANQADDTGVTPLHLGAAQNAEVVKLLLEAGAKPNAQDAGGNTPMHAAAAAGKADVIDLLVAKAGNVNSINLERRTPLTLAQQGNHTAAADALKGR